MAAVLWPGRPSLATHPLRHLSPRKWPNSSLKAVLKATPGELQPEKRVVQEKRSGRRSRKEAATWTPESRDEFTREALAILVARKLSSADVIDVLADLFLAHVTPAHIRTD